MTRTQLFAWAAFGVAVGFLLTLVAMQEVLPLLPEGAWRYMGAGVAGVACLLLFVAITRKPRIETESHPIPVRRREPVRPVDSANVVEAKYRYECYRLLYHRIDSLLNVTRNAHDYLDSLAAACPRPYWIRDLFNQLSNRVANDFARLAEPDLERLAEEARHTDCADWGNLLDRAATRCRDACAPLKQVGFRWFLEHELGQGLEEFVETHSQEIPLQLQVAGIPLDNEHIFVGGGEELAGQMPPTRRTHYFRAQNADELVFIRLAQGLDDPARFCDPSR